MANTTNDWTQTDCFIAEIEVRAAHDALERASDIYDVFCVCAMNEGADPETDPGCSLARAKREIAAVYLREVLDKRSERA